MPPSRFTTRGPTTLVTYCKNITLAFLRIGRDSRAVGTVPMAVCADASEQRVFFAVSAR
jgi:hypothetical protein